jgi:hypothetical protein
MYETYKAVKLIAKNYIIKPVKFSEKTRNDKVINLLPALIDTKKKIIILNTDFIGLLPLEEIIDYSLIVDTKRNNQNKDFDKYIDKISLNTYKQIKELKYKLKFDNLSEKTENTKVSNNLPCLIDEARRIIIINTGFTGIIPYGHFLDYALKFDRFLSIKNIYKNSYNLQSYKGGLNPCR